MRIDVEESAQTEPLPDADQSEAAILRRHVGENSLYVLRNYIDLEIYFIVRLEVGEVCNFPGLGNHGYLEIFIR